MQNGIVVHSDVTLERHAGISDTDIVAILANLMENALYGCITCGEKDPVIDVYIGRKLEKLVIYVCNTAINNVVFENGLPKSQISGGVGVASILHSVSHYSGSTLSAIRTGFLAVKFCCKTASKYKLTR